MAKIVLRNIRSSKRKAAIEDLNSIVRKQIEEHLDKVVKPAIQKSFEQITSSWKSDIKWQTRKVISSDIIAVYAYPTGKDKQIWEYVDKGTKPHPITAKNVPYLKFQWGGPGSYVPKTMPNPARINPSGGYVKNPTWRSPKTVQHPGSEGRMFTETIAKDLKEPFAKTIDNAFKKAQRATME